MQDWPLEASPAKKFLGEQWALKYELQIFLTSALPIFFRIQSLSPLKKKIQELNTNIISNLNESYKEAAIQEAKYQGEGTADYYRS